jgi:hypothetical protein
MSPPTVADRHGAKPPDVSIATFIGEFYKWILDESKLSFQNLTFPMAPGLKTERSAETMETEK